MGKKKSADQPAHILRQINTIVASCLGNKAYTMQSLYNTPHYNRDVDIARSCCGSQTELSWNTRKMTMTCSQIEAPFSMIKIDMGNIDLILKSSVFSNTMQTVCKG